METEIVNLDPSKVLADDNLRFSLRADEVAARAQSILTAGEVLEPVEVEELTKPLNGFTHRLTFGYIRHAAVQKLNKENNAGLTLPAIVRNTGDVKSRFQHQLMENNDRTAMSPMDIAVSIHKALAAGYSKIEVREMFKRPGGKKGNVVQAASPAWIGIMLGLLELPKSIQADIHEGRVSYTAAYELSKVPAEKRADILARAKAEVLKQVETEEKDGQKLMEAVEKVEKAQGVVAEVKTEAEAIDKELADIKQAINETTSNLKLAEAELKEIKKSPWLEMTPEEKTVTGEKLKKAEADVKGIKKVQKDETNKLATLVTKKLKADEKVKAAQDKAAQIEENRKKLAEARGKAKAPKSSVGPADVKRAVKAAGGKDAGHVALTISDARQTFKDLAKSENPAIKLIGDALGRLLTGELTPKTLIGELEVILGGAKDDPLAAPVAAAKPSVSERLKKK